MNIALNKVPEPGELILRYIQRIQPKEEDRWDGPYVFIKILGKRMVQAVNLETNRLSHIHVKDIKKYGRPNVSNWRLNKNKISLEEIGLESLDGFEDTDMSKDWRKRRIFADINHVHDLDDVYKKALKDQPESLLLVVPGWKELSATQWMECVQGEALEITPDSDGFLIGDREAGFRVWKCWIVPHSRKQLLQSCVQRSKNQVSRGSRRGDMIAQSFL